MDWERENYAEPPGPPLGLRELAWALGLFLAPALIVILMALWYVIGSRNY